MFGPPRLPQYAWFEARTVSELVEVGLVVDSRDQTARVQVHADSLLHAASRSREIINA